MASTGDRFVELRKYFGNQPSAAAAAGISVSSWKTYEAGKLPGGDALGALSKRGISVDWLLSGDGDMLRENNGIGDPRLKDPNAVYAAYDLTAAGLVKLGFEKPDPSLVSSLFLHNLQRAHDGLQKAATDATDN